MFNKIKIAFFDVDGCLSDGVYQISEEGSVIKSFYTRDFYGLEQLMRNNILVVILTQSHDEVISQQIQRICDHSDFWKENYYRCNNLQLFTGIDDKRKLVERYFESDFRGEEITWDNIAYFGDAENDLECIKLAGFSGCPTDAIPEVREIAMYPSDYYGGKGAVHDFCKHILAQKNKEKKDENS